MPNWLIPFLIFDVILTSALLWYFVNQKRK